MKKFKIFQKAICFFCAMTMIVCTTAPAFASEYSAKQISLQNTNNIASSSHNFMRWATRQFVLIITEMDTYPTQFP